MIKTSWIAVASAALVVLCGCGSAGGGGAAGGDSAAKKGAKAVIGTYVYSPDPKVAARLAEDDAAAAQVKAKAAAGDAEAKKALAYLPKDPPTEARLQSGFILTISPGGSFEAKLPDVSTGKIGDATGTYALDDTGSKLTLTILELNGARAEGADAKPVTMAFDAKAGTLTYDTGGGPALVMKKR